MVIDERVAGFVALGLAKRSGRAVALICTSGSAGAHYLPALVEAKHAGIALIVLTADRPPESHYVGSGQTMQQTHLFGTYVKACIQLGAPTSEGIRWTAAAAMHAVRLAEAYPTAGVHINAAFRKPFWKPGDDAGQVRRQLQRVQTEYTAAALPDEVQSLIRGAHRGLIVVGPLIGMHTPDRTRIQQSILTFARQAQWPILADVLSGLRVPQTIELCIDGYDSVLRDADRRKVLTPDLIISFGDTPTSRVLNSWLKTCKTPDHLRFEQNGRWPDPDGLANVLIEGCANALNTFEIKPISDDWRRQWLDAQAAIHSTLDHVFETKAQALTEPAIARILAAFNRPDDCIHLASGQPVRDFFDAYYTRSTGPDIVANRGVNGIDGMVSTSIGLALSRSKGHVICVLGDIATRHDLGGMLAASETDCDLIVIVVDNGGGGIFKRLLIKAHRSVFERYFYTPQRNGLPTLLKPMARRFVTVDHPDALKKASMHFATNPAYPSFTLVST